MGDAGDKEIADRERVIDAARELGVWQERGVAIDADDGGVKMSVGALIETSLEPVFTNPTEPATGPQRTLVHDLPGVEHSVAAIVNIAPLQGVQQIRLR